MILELYNGNKSIDVYSNTDIRFTFQVNDIAEVKDRQASYTNQFTIPKTPHNVRVFQGLGISSDTSNIPYQKPDSRLKLDGYDLIRKGWMNITSTDDDYKVYIYSGIVNLFKAIENKNMGDLDLSDLNHNKTLTTVINSFAPESNKPYRYLIADYNGDSIYEDSVNIDYLVPSVRISYLWDKIHQTFNFDPKGSIFDTPEFKNWWMTYPKAANPEDVFVEIFSASSSMSLPEFHGFPVNSRIQFIILQNEKITEGVLVPYGEKFNNYQPNLKGHFEFPASADYKIEISGKIVFDRFIVGRPNEGVFRCWMGINSAGKTPSEAINSSITIGQNNNGSYEVYVNFEQISIANPGDSICIGTFTPVDLGVNEVQMNIKISRVKYEAVDFTSQLKDMSINSFIKEVLVDMGLTAFTNENNNEIDYLTLDERLKSSKVIDWSDKYISRKSESYTYKDYAQKNTFAYKHNDQESEFNNGSIIIQNPNLSDTKTVYQSFAYSPEAESSTFNLPDSVPFITKIHKMWDREISKDSSIKYKPLEKRFYFLRERRYDNNLKLGSKSVKRKESVTSFSAGLFQELSYDDIIAKNYDDFSKILTDSRIHTIDLDLNTVDLLQLDMKALYFFKQEAQYYILNKLTANEKSASGEFIRVKRFANDEVIPENYIVINWIDSNINDDLNRSSYIAIATIVGEPTNAKWQQKSNNNDWFDIGPVVGGAQKNIIFAEGKNFVRVVYTNSSGQVYTNTLPYQKGIVESKCFEFDLRLGEPGTITVTYYNYSSVLVSEPITFLGIEQIKTIYGKQIVNSGGAGVIEEREVPCPVYECRSYRVSAYGGSGDTLNVTWTDCSGVEQNYSQTASGPGTDLGITVCARKDQITYNIGTLYDEGLC